VSKNRVTTQELYREIDKLQIEVHTLRAESLREMLEIKDDMRDIKAIAVRVRDLEGFRSYTKGISACVAFILPILFWISRYFQ
jgi:hypothetical protein